VVGVLSKDKATIGKYLQTWKLKLSSTNTVSAVKHTLKVNFNNETRPFAPNPNTSD